MIAPIVNERDIRVLRQCDIINNIHKMYGKPPSISRPEGFETLVKIILEQQLSLASAKAHFDKLQAYVKTITPISILELSPTELRACQLSRQKARYVIALARAIVDQELNLEDLSHATEAEVRAQLTAIKGIGDWTAEVYLMFSLQAKDIFPLGDIAIINTMKELTMISSKQAALDRAAAWRPLRSLASYYLWHYYLKKRNREWVSG